MGLKLNFFSEFVIFLLNWMGLILKQYMMGMFSRILDKVLSILSRMIFIYIESVSCQC